jgi:hypothetical protein
VGTIQKVFQETESETVNRVCPVQNTVQSRICKTRKKYPPSVRGRVLDHSSYCIYVLNRVVVFTELPSDLRLDRLQAC